MKLKVEGYDFNGTNVSENNIFGQYGPFSHATLCCQWYEQVGDISISPD